MRSARKSSVIAINDNIARGLRFCMIASAWWSLINHVVRVIDKKDEFAAKKPFELSETRGGCAAGQIFTDAEPFCSRFASLALSLCGRDRAESRELPVSCSVCQSIGASASLTALYSLATCACRYVAAECDNHKARILQQRTRSARWLCHPVAHLGR